MDITRTDPADGEIDRSDTAIRILFSLVFAVAISIGETLIFGLVVFQLGYTLITRRPPPPRVAEFGNAMATYFYRVLRYLTHNESDEPFPFSELPKVLEDSTWTPPPPRDTDD